MCIKRPSLGQTIKSVTHHCHTCPLLHMACMQQQQQQQNHSATLKCSSGIKQAQRAPLCLWIPGFDSYLVTVVYTDTNTALKAVRPGAELERVLLRVPCALPAPLPSQPWTCQQQPVGMNMGHHISSTSKAVKIVEASK